MTEQTDTQDAQTVPPASDATPPPPPPPPAAPAKGGDDPYANTPFAGLDEDGRFMVERRGWKGIGDVLNTVKNLDQKLGGDTVDPFPTDPEKWAEWEGWEKAGAVKDVAEFEGKLTDLQLPEGMPVDQDLDSAIQQVGVKARMTPQQVDMVRQGFAEIMGTRYSNLMQDQAAAEAEIDKQLTQLYGKDTATNLTLAEEFLTGQAKQILGEEADIAGIINTMKASAGGLQTVQLLVGMALNNQSHGTPHGGGPGAYDGAMSPERALQEIQTLEANEAFMDSLKTTGHKDHAANKERRERLYKIAYAENS